MSLMQEWSDQCRAEHAAQVEKGKHDDECEWRDNGHFLCNCTMRKRVASGFTEPPTLHIQYPMCSRCWQEVSHDGDSFVCTNCNVSWSSTNEDTPGTFTDDNGVLNIEKWDAERLTRKETP